MKIQNIVKIANVIGMVMMLVLAIAPVAVSAQLNIPGAGNTGLPEDANITEFILRIINILLGVVGLIAVLFLIIGGFRYITAGGNEETAESGKKTIINAIIGIIIVILSFVIVRVISNAVKG